MMIKMGPINCLSTSQRFLMLMFIYIAINSGYLSKACRVSSERLKLYTRSKIDYILDAEQLASLYWPNEPLDADALSRATGINITLAETKFDLTGSRNTTVRPTFVRDMFITCSADRTGSYTLTINLELTNPFKVIEGDFLYQPQEARQKRDESDQEVKGRFRIHLPKSTFLARLNQRISYDECLDLSYIQLSPNVAYDIDCLGCEEELQRRLDKTINKRIGQLDAELDLMLSEKLLFSLQSVLSQQRIDLDLYLSASSI